MIYAQWTDMVERFSLREMTQLSDRDGIGEVNTSVLTRALDDATAFADSYLGRVYALPLAGCAKPVTTPGAVPARVPPPVLTRLVCDVARYYLYTDAPEEHEAKRRYKFALKEFEGIAEGKTQLTCPWGGPPGAALHSDALQGQEAFHSFAPRAINDDSLRGYA